MSSHISVAELNVFSIHVCTCNYAINTILLMSTDTLPTLLDDVEYVVRAQDKAPESDVPQEEEKPGSEPQNEPEVYV